MKNITINKKEIDKFSKLATEWWDPYGKFKPLHKFNPIRLDYIKKSIIKKLKKVNTYNSLKKIKILDIGCGGGLLCEPLSKLGAQVVGIDASEKNIKIAKVHAKKNNLRINYYCASPENFISKEKFDVVLNMEIIEHVQNVNLFLKESSKFLKKDGIMFIATLNKTLKSYLFAILGAEYLLRWLPIGTHDWNKFIKPEELEKYLTEKKFKTLDIKGLEFNPINSKWKRSDNLSVNYIICSKKD